MQRHVHPYLQWRTHEKQRHLQAHSFFLIHLHSRHHQHSSVDYANSVPRTLRAEQTHTLHQYHAVQVQHWKQAINRASQYMISGHAVLQNCFLGATDGVRDILTGVPDGSTRRELAWRTISWVASACLLYAATKLSCISRTTYRFDSGEVIEPMQLRRLQLQMQETVHSRVEGFWNESKCVKWGQGVKHKYTNPDHQSNGIITCEVDRTQ